METFDIEEIEVDPEQQTFGEQEYPEKSVRIKPGQGAIILDEDQRARFERLYEQTTGGYGGLTMDEDEFVDWCLEMLDVMVVNP